MATETTLDGVASTNLKGLMQALWGLKEGSTTIMQLIEAIDGGLKVGLPKLASERNADDTTGQDYASTAQEWKSVTVDTGGLTTDIVVYAGPALVDICRVRNTTAAGLAIANTVGVILLKDGSTVKEGAAAAKTPGSIIFDGRGGTIFATSIVLNCASASDDDKIEILYRPLDPTVTW